jgi:hypothetical protein
MKTNLKILTIVIAFVMLISMACVTTTPAPTPTDVPTQTALPTYTPQPTYTPYPTAVPPTAVPTAKPKPPVQKSQPTSGDYDVSMYKGSGPVQQTCPSASNTPAIVSSMLCYEISGYALGLVYFDSNDDLLAIGIAVLVSNSNSAYDAGVFAGQTAVMYGWSIDDLLGVMNQIKQPDTTYTYGSLKGRATNSDDGTMVYMLFMPVNSNFQGI